MKTIFATSLALLALAGPALAAPVIITGHGTDSCAEFSQSRVISPVVEESYYVWVQGFMSGANAIALSAKTPAHDAGHLSEDDLKKALRDYCSAHPGDNFATATVKLMFSFPEVPPTK